MDAAPADLAAMVAQAVRSAAVGIAPHRGGAEREEYQAVPLHLRNGRGLPADEVAHLLASERPELGIESERDLLAALADGTRQRRDGTAAQHYEYPPAGVAGAMDPRSALADFALLLDSLDEHVVDQLREAWGALYRTTGHRALGRYLVTGDMAFAAKSLEKRGVAS